MNHLILIYALATNSFNLPVGLMSAVCFTESSHNPVALHKDDGSQDSVGLCQLHLSTAKLVGYKGTAKDLLNPSTNVHFAALYLKHQIIRYNGDVSKAVAAYNAGSYIPGQTGAKNQKYVNKVFLNWAKRK